MAPKYKFRSIHLGCYNQIFVYKVSNTKNLVMIYLILSQFLSFKRVS